MISKKEFLKRPFFCLRSRGHSRKKARYWARVTWPINRDVGMWAKENNEQNIQKFKEFCRKHNEQDSMV